MRNRGIQLSRRHRGWFYGIFTTLFLSGLFWWIFHNWLQTKGDFGLKPHPLEKWWLKLHGAAAMGALVVLGTLLPLHMKRAWHARRNRSNGLSLIIVCLVLIVTGYGLYYLGGESDRAAASWVHTYLGLALPLVIAIHIWQGRKTRQL